MPSGRISGGGSKTGNIVTGTEGADTLRGTTSNDVIDGRGGADTMRGGRGNDIYYVDNSGDSVIELAGEGLDEVRSTVGYALPANVENLTLLGVAGFGVGNALDNRLTGNEAANTLRGLEGSDFMVGGGGDDLLDGGLGGDHLDGGAGNDTYVVDNPTDFVFERTAGGTDTVMSAINYQLFPELENLTLIDGAYVGMGNYRDNQLTGNGLDNRLDGQEGNDQIDGMAGDDTLNGGIGVDYLIGGAGADRFVFDGTAGNDQIHDFETGIDKVDLSAFAITSSQVAATPSGNDTLLSVDSNKDGVADFTITLVGVGPPAPTDYIF